MRAGGYLPTTPALWGPPVPLWGGRDQSLLCYLSPSSDSLLIFYEMPGPTACLTAPITVCLPSCLLGSASVQLSLCHSVLKLRKHQDQCVTTAHFISPLPICQHICRHERLLNLIWCWLTVQRRALQWEWYYKTRALQSKHNHFTL